MGPRLIHRRYRVRGSHNTCRSGWAVVGKGMEINLCPNEAGVLLAAMFAPGIVRVGEIIDALWGDDPEGGPDSAEKAVHVYVCRLNQVLRGFGWEIRGRQTGGGYRLERFSGKAVPRVPGRGGPVAGRKYVERIHRASGQQSPRSVDLLGIG